MARPVASCETTSVVKRLRLCQTGEALASTVQDSGDGLSSSSLPCESPNPFPAGALQQNQQDVLILPSAPSAVQPNVTMQEISFWTMSPADDLSEASCHDAENFSRKVLCVREVPVRKDIECLFNLLPHEKPSRGNGQGRSFSCGMFAQGPLRGLRVGSRRFPLSCQVLTAFARACAPKHVFTSLNLFLNVRTSLHVDANNDRYPNLVAGVSNFSRGQILVENPSGKHVMQTPSGGVSADLLEVAGTHVLFDAYKFKHETMDWTGDRLVLVAFSVKGSEIICDADRMCLLEQGFVLPPVPECSTNNPPTRALPCDGSCLPPRLTDRAFGRCLDDLHFLEIFLRHWRPLCRCQEIRDWDLHGSRFSSHGPHSLSCPAS